MRVALLALAFASAAIAGCGGTTAIGASSLDGSAEAAPDFAMCSGNGACVLSTSGCCGSCGEVDFSEWVAVSRARLDAWRMSTCPAPPPCPRCAVIPNANYQAFCREARCVAIDVRMDVISSCATDADCVLRYPDCCGCGSGIGELIALRADALAEYEHQVCASACAADCAGSPPPEAHALCNPTTARCAVVVSAQ